MVAGRAVWAHAGFALGYAEHGVFPVSPAANASCVALQETSQRFDAQPVIGWIVEAGRTEGKRSAREKAHRKLYGFHAAELSGLLAPILGRLDLDAVSAALVAKAKEQADAQYAPVDRRKAVQAIALASIAQHVTTDDQQNLNAANAAGWAHATAYGTAEAQSTPPAGGPPDPSKVAAAAAMALSQIEAGTAADATATWTATELQTIAMGAALAAGDGADLNRAIRAVKASLVDTGRATQVYADELHGAVVQAFVSNAVILRPDVLFDWLTDADPCEDCEGYAIEGPYLEVDLPDFPPHPNCRCAVEVSSDPRVFANA